LAAFATYAGPLGKFLTVHTHNAQLGRIVGMAGRIAGEISDTLATLPAGASTADIKAKLLASGVAEIKGEMDGSVAAIGMSNPQLLTMITREMAKLPPKASASVLGEAVTAAVTVAADPAPAVAPAPSTSKETAP
jgi:hypothetical protein